MLRAAWIMLCKDLRLFLGDRVALLLAVLLPIVLVTVFGTVMSNMAGGGGGGGMPAVDLMVLDEDQSDASRAFVTSLQDSDGVDLTTLLLEKDGVTRTRDDLVAAVYEGDSPFALRLPPGFGEGADLELLRDPGRGLSQQLLSISLVRALFEARGEDMIWDIQRRSMTAAGIPDEWMTRVDSFTTPFRNSMESMFDDADQQGLLDDEAADEGTGGDDGGDFDFAAILDEVLPMQVEDIAPEGRDQEVTYIIAQAVSGMTVMMLMFSLVGYARSLIEERDRGTLRRLLLAPVDRRAVLLSKFLGTYVVGLILTLILFIYASMLFELDVLSRLDTVLVISMATAAATTGFAVLISAICNTDKQADGLSTILILTMSALGGAWFPLMFLPEFLQTIARFTLPFWSIDSYLQTFWYGKHWTDPSILTNLGVLLALSAALGWVASIVYRRRYLAG